MDGTGFCELVGEKAGRASLRLSWCSNDGEEYFKFLAGARFSEIAVEEESKLAIL